VQPPRGSLLKKTLLLLLCAGGVWLYVGRVIRTYRADRAADGYRITGLERATRLAPGNVLGLQLSESSPDRDRAIANLRAAARLAPEVAQYWLDLAYAYQLAGNVHEQNAALENALLAEPNNPDIAAESAQYYLVEGDIQRSLPLLRRALEMDPTATADLLPAYWRAVPDAQQLLDQAIPADPQPQIAFLRLLAERNETTAARQVWNRVLASPRSFQPQAVFFYFDYLIRKHQVADLGPAWHEFSSAVPAFQPYQPNGNLIVNPGFELEPLNGGLDWRHEDAGNVFAGIDDKVAHWGSRSLTVTFDGNPAYLAGWRQLIPVQPGADYTFSAWIKSENTVSSSGPRFAIVDAYSGARFLLTEDVLDTQPWHEMSGTLRVPDGTALLELEIVRAPADTGIRGRIWIDDLALVRK
jgi:tetratricopeptide (TPR) repeat protein